MPNPPQPVVFIHGLWLHSSSWQPWIDVYTAAGYAPVAPPWPGDGPTVAETRAHPELVANHGVGQVVDHYAALIATLPAKPIVIGHSFGGLIAQILLGRGVAEAAVAIDPAQMKGVLPLPLVQLQSGLPVLSRLSQIKGANIPSKKQWHQSFASEVTQEEADALYNQYAIPSPGKPLFQAAIANLQAHSETTVNFMAERGPLLITGGAKDRTVPEVTSRYAYNLYAKAGAKTVNDYHVFAGRGHSLGIDGGWRAVADYTLGWLKQHSL